MTTESFIALLALTGMEIVLGIDNIIFIAVITARLPTRQQNLGRRLGLAAALVTRVLLLFLLTFIMGSTRELFSLTSLGLPADWVHEEMNHVSLRDLILLGGGLFLIAKSVYEIHELHHDSLDDGTPARTKRFGVVIVEIAILDIVFSLDSVITAVGMAEDLSIMVAAICIAILVMMCFAKSVSLFVESNPTIKTLALSFLILIGIMLVAESIGQEIDKGYIYFAMAFALVVELLNMRMRASHSSAATVDSTTAPD